MSYVDYSCLAQSPGVSDVYGQRLLMFGPLTNINYFVW